MYKDYERLIFENIYRDKSKKISHEYIYFLVYKSHTMVNTNSVNSVEIQSAKQSSKGKKDGGK